MAEEYFLFLIRTVEEEIKTKIIPNLKKKTKKPKTTNPKQPFILSEPVLPKSGLKRHFRITERARPKVTDCLFQL